MSDPADLANVPAAVRRIERTISTVLRVGVLVSLAVIVTGTVISFLHHPGYLRSPQELTTLTTPGAKVPRSLADISAGIADGRGQAVVMLGLLLLIATPILRVAISIFAFLSQRDWTFTILTGIVLTLLILSFFLGKA